MSIRRTSLTSAETQRRGSLFGRDKFPSLRKTSLISGSDAKLAGGSQAPMRSVDRAVQAIWQLFRNVVGPALIMLFAPLFVFLQQHALSRCEGSYRLMWAEFRQKGIVWSFSQIRPHCFEGDAWKAIAAFCALQAVLIRIMPSFVDADSTPHHARRNSTVLQASKMFANNGFECFLFTLALFFIGHSWRFYDAGFVYDHLAELLSSLCVIALTLSILMYAYGKLFSLPNVDSATPAKSEDLAGFIHDFYYGFESQLQMLGWNFKQMVICRFAMLFWAVACLSFALKQKSLYGGISSSLFVSTALQLAYIATFFCSEQRFLLSASVYHQRIAFYVCFGSLVWLPYVSTSHIAFLVERPRNLGAILSSLILVFGFGALWILRDCDRQRQRFQASNGSMKIWNNDPLFIEAKFKTFSGDIGSTLLFGSGYWGLVRHCRFLPEVFVAFTIVLPVFAGNLAPYCYLFHVIVTLFVKALSEEERRHQKYGKCWDIYCKHVPFMLIPRIF